jgi:hypothetical protein
MRSARESRFGGKEKRIIKQRRRPVAEPLTWRSEFETLDTRIVPVVNAVASFPAAIGPGAGFDGIVQVFHPVNGSCTGTLLSTGRHILTAAHCVDNDVDTSSPPDGVPDRGNGRVDAGNHVVQFDLAGRTVRLNVPAARITLEGGWNGRFSQGSDIAIMQLPELAPVGVERRGIYRDRDEIQAQGESFNFLGYGATNRTNTTDNGTCPGPSGTICSGNFGQSNNPPVQAATAFGIKRLGANVIDAVQTLGGTGQTDEYLRFDLDDPNSTMDSGTFGEAMSAQGDSGGPLFIAGLVAGVSSGTTDTVTSYGDNAWYTRVSSFADWIDQTLAEPYDLVIDMQNQVAGNDGNADIVSLTRGVIPFKSGERILIGVNGVGVYDDLVSSIRRITIRGSGDDDTMSVPGDLGIRLSVDGRGGLFNDFEIRAVANATTYLATDFFVNVAGPSGAFMGYSAMTGLTIEGDANDTVRVAGTNSLTTTSLVGTGTVIVGQGGNTSAVRGSVYIFGPPSSVNLTVDNSSGPDRQTVTVWDNRVNGMASGTIHYPSGALASLTLNGGMAGNAFTVEFTPSAPLKLNTGTGADTVDIKRAAANTTVNGQNGADTVNVGSNGTIRGIIAPVHITNAGNWSTINLDDSSDTFSRNVTLNVAGNLGTINGLAPATISYRRQDLRALNVWAGNGDDTIDVMNTAQSTIPGGSPTAVYAGDGFDGINVFGTTGPLVIDPQGSFNTITIGGRPGPGGSLNNIRGDITLLGAEGFRDNFVDVLDRASTGRYNYTMDAQRIQRTTRTGSAATGNINYGAFRLDGLTLIGANRGNHFQINGTPAADASVVHGGVNVITGDGSDSATVLASVGQLNVDFGIGASHNIVIGNAAHSLDEVGVVNVIGRGFIDAGISDEASTASRAATIDYKSGYETVERLDVPGSGATLNTFRFAFADRGRINYRAGQASDGQFNQVSVQGVPANTHVIVSGGPGYDIFSVESATQTTRTLGPVTILSPQADIDLAYYYDQFNPNPQSYTVRTDPLVNDTVFVERLGSAAVSYGGLTQLILAAPQVGGNSVNVQSLPSSLFLNMVVSDGDAVTLSSSAPGSGGTIASIAGPIVVSSYGVDDSVTLTVDDSGNSTTARNVAIAPYEPSGPWGLITGLTGSSLLFRDYANWKVNVRGGQLDDKFVMSGDPLTADISIDGGNGNDALVGSGGVKLFGGSGRDLLIAGALDSILDGGADEDILVGGTLQDSSTANLDAIIAEWVKTGTGNDYNSRVAILRANLLADGKVTGNGGNNALTGGSSALDLFFGSLVTDWQQGEQIVPA